MWHQPIEELIRTRRSVRDYQVRPIEPATLAKLAQSFIRGHSPFGHPVRFAILADNAITGPADLMSGTYGFIKNAPAYLIGITVAGANLNMIDFGYRFEEMILCAHDLGLGSCWLGGSLKRQVISRSLDLASGEVVPCISPLGYAAPKERIFTKIVRLSAKSDHRLKFSELFFQGDALTPLPEDSTLARSLEMVRLAPSASNRQPWRVLVSSTAECHFFLKRTAGYKQFNPDIDLQRIDMGIAMFHFDAMQQELGRTGRWQILPQTPLASLADWEYVVSYVSAA
jgi:nitroreductase